MIESQTTTEIFYPLIQVGDLSSPVHRQMATPNFQSADGSETFGIVCCFVCCFGWTQIHVCSTVTSSAIECPSCGAIAGIPLESFEQSGANH